MKYALVVMLLTSVCIGCTKEDSDFPYTGNHYECTNPDHSAFLQSSRTIFVNPVGWTPQEYVWYGSVDAEFYVQPVCRPATADFIDLSMVKFNGAILPEFVNASGRIHYYSSQPTYYTTDVWSVHGWGRLQDFSIVDSFPSVVHPFGQFDDVDKSVGLSFYVTLPGNTDGYFYIENAGVPSWYLSPGLNYVDLTNGELDSLVAGSYNFVISVDQDTRPVVSDLTLKVENIVTYIKPIDIY